MRALVNNHVCVVGSRYLQFHGIINEYCKRFSLLVVYRAPKMLHVPRLLYVCYGYDAPNLGVDVDYDGYLEC